MGHYQGGQTEYRSRKGKPGVSDTVTLTLQGTVSLSDFSTAVARFHALIAALSVEAQAQDVAWEIDDLDTGSATTTTRGTLSNGAHPERIDRVVRSYLEVGRALEQRITIPYSAVVRREAEALVGVLKGSQIEEVRFETAESEAIVREVTEAREGARAQTAERRGAYGAVTGRVQTLTSRSGLRFTVYDHIHDKAVPCYLVEGREDMMREMWDRLAHVEGWVTRDPESGRPLAVRRVTGVTPITEAEPEDYLRARGAVPLGADGEKPEQTIRRLRDAG